jgi:sulfoxide reductase heme-binding subunit YedZ
MSREGILVTTSPPGRASGVRRPRSPARREQFRRRLVRHHAPIGGLTTAGVASIIVLTPGSAAFRISIATAYVGLALLVTTLLIGPVRALRGRSQPLSSDLRRDIGIWTAFTALTHVAAGLLVHMGGRPWLYFLKPFSELDGHGISGIWPFKTDRFGLANDIGLVATLIVAMLLLLSNDLTMRRLGGRRWKSLQRLNYVLFALVVGHGILYQQLESRAVALIALSGLFAMTVLAFQAAGFKATRSRAAMRPGLK